jgi:type I restriction enzyme, S subunit
MAGEWIDTTVGEQATLQRGMDITKVEQRAGRIPVVSSGGISSYHDTPAASGPGVILGRKGVVGSVYYVSSDYWPHDTTLWVKDFHGNDQRFVYYFFQWLAPRIATMDVGSANPTLNRNHVHPIEVCWPAQVSEQRAIAHILGTLDDKIDLNRRMNETLEAIAQALFKSWFVDFVPVRAKAEGRDPGLPKPLADLFPDSFEDSELGWIPKGWRVISLGELCRRVAMGPFGSDIKTDNFIEVGVPVIRGCNLTDGFMDDGFVYLSEKKADSLRNANAFAGDIVITHRGTLGQVGLIPRKSTFPRYVVSQSQMLLSADPCLLTPRFLFEYLRSSAGQHQLLANTSQTGVPAIARPTTSVKAMRLVLPQLHVLQRFEDLLRPMIERSVRNIAESRTLSALRDALLPKLISGELRVRVAKSFEAA